MNPAELVGVVMAQWAVEDVPLTVAEAHRLATVAVAAIVQAQQPGQQPKQQPWSDDSRGMGE